MPYEELVLAVDVSSTPAFVFQRCNGQALAFIWVKHPDLVAALFAQFVCRRFQCGSQCKEHWRIKFHVENPGAGSVRDDTISPEFSAHVLMEKAYIAREKIINGLKFVV